MSEHPLPYIDEHTVEVDVSRDLVWTTLRGSAFGLRFGRHNPLAAMLGTEPRNGFGIAEIVPGERLTLEGKHHFSRYRLQFEIASSSSGTAILSAKTYAEFPGLRGRIYRTLVIGSGAHAVITAQMVRAICSRSVRRAAQQQKQ